MLKIVISSIVWQTTKYAWWIKNDVFNACTTNISLFNTYYKLVCNRMLRLVSRNDLLHWFMLSSKIKNCTLKYFSKATIKNDFSTNMDLEFFVIELNQSCNQFIYKPMYSFYELFWCMTHKQWLQEEMILTHYYRW